RAGWDALFAARTAPFVRLAPAAARGDRVHASLTHQRTRFDLRAEAAATRSFLRVDGATRRPIAGALAWNRGSSQVTVAALRVTPGLGLDSEAAERRGEASMAGLPRASPLAFSVPA